MDRLQWGNRKRLRCVKVKHSSSSSSSFFTTNASAAANPNGNGAPLVCNNNNNNKITSTRLIHNDEHQPQSAAAAATLPPLHSPQRLNNRDLGMNNRLGGSENGRTPDKEDRYYTTRGSGGLVDEATTKLFTEAREEKRKAVWPRLYLALSNKEKEEDFLTMKGCKLPHRPKKRAKLIQKSILLVSPGTWLSDLTQERYEVREKKTSKKKPRGLKAMGSMESDSE